MQCGQKKKPHAVRTKSGRPRKPSGHVRPSKRHRRKRCGAKTKSGRPCRTWAMPNGRCRMHGGKSPKGADHPRFATGLHSKYYEKRLSDLLQDDTKVGQDLANLDLEGMDDEVRLAAAMLMLHMSRKTGEVDREWIKEAVDLIDNLTKQKERRHKMQKELRTITLGELQSMIKRFTILVAVGIDRFVKGKEPKQRFLEYLDTIPEQIAVSVEA